MNATPPAIEATPPAAYSLWELVRYMLALGSWGFGGPVALVGYMYRDLVEQRHWISESDYKEGMALAQLMPGPLAAQLAIYLGYVHFRVRGATLVGLAFVLPSFLMVVAIGAVYAAYGGIAWMQAGWHEYRTRISDQRQAQALGLRPGPAGAPERQTIAVAFGRFDAWETEFRKIGAGLGGGSGWVVLGFNQHTRQLENYWLADQAHGPAATTPVLVMDMYEHSYQMDFGAAAAKYIDAFFQNIQWDTVAARMATLPKA